jgi:hypothetical protein
MMSNNVMYRGRCIGSVEGDTLVKKGKQVQLYRVFDGFGLSSAVLDTFKDIRIEYEGKIYRATVELIKQKGVLKQFKEDLQYVVPRKYWVVEDPKQLSLI